MLTNSTDMSATRAVHLLEISMEFSSIVRLEKDMQEVLQLAIETHIVLPCFLILSRIINYSYNV